MQNTIFLQDEVRCGFYIPTVIKQAWATQLDILAEIDRICQKYSLSYYADYGTLLGAVRHKGYIPWDDDIDISMKRSDYSKFIKLAESELPKTYSIRTFETSDNYWHFSACITNTDTICFEKEHLDKNYNFPFISGIDIFVLDNLYIDSEKEKERSNEILRLIAVSEGILNNSISQANINKELHDFQNKYNIQFDISRGNIELVRQLHRLAEQQLSRVDDSNSSSIDVICSGILNGGKGLPKSYFDKSILLPFENTMIPAPANYSSVLQHRFGNYMVIKKGTMDHTYPYYETQKKNLLANSNDLFFSYEFTSDMLLETKYLTQNGLKQISNEFLENISYYLSIILKKTILANELIEFQQLLIDYGTFLEKCFEGTTESISSIISMIEDLCEEIYKLFNILQNSSNNYDTVCLSIQLVHQKLEKKIQQDIVTPTYILFLTTGSSHWNSYDTIYRNLQSNKSNKLFVVYTPLLKKDIYGCITDDSNPDDIVSHFPDDINILSWKNYNIELIQPDIIYTQDAHDNQNPCLSIPPKYYTKYLKQYTQQLIYIPRISFDDYDDKDAISSYTANIFYRLPGVIYSDSTYVQSLEIRNKFIDSLTTIAGPSTRLVWNKKIQIIHI